MLVQLGRQNRARWLPQRWWLFADDPLEPRHCECANSQEQALLGVTPEPAVLVARFLAPWVRGRLELRECQPWQEEQTSDERSRRSSDRPWSRTARRALDGRCKQRRRRTIQSLWPDERLSEPARAFLAWARIFEGGGQLAYVFLEAPRKNQQPASGVEEVVKMNRAFLIVGRDFGQHDRQHWLADHGRLQHGAGVETHDSSGVVQRIEVIVLRRRVDRMAAEQCDVLEFGEIDFLPLLEPPRMRPDEYA